MLFLEKIKDWDESIKEKFKACKKKRVNHSEENQS
jgi:hypothetical protein